jgi:hypothetical protein
LQLPPRTTPASTPATRREFPIALRPLRAHPLLEAASNLPQRFAAIMRLTHQNPKLTGVRPRRLSPPSLRLPSTDLKAYCFPRGLQHFLSCLPFLSPPVKTVTLRGVCPAVSKNRRARRPPIV